MECKKREYDDDTLQQQKGLARSSYKSRKECIKMKTMQLATLCGIDACTIIVGPRGDIESWPQNPKQAKAILDKFKDLTTNKRVAVRDESRNKVADFTQVEDGIKDVRCQKTAIRDGYMKKDLAKHDGEVLSWLENPRGGSNIPETFQENAGIIDLTEMVEKKSSLGSRRSPLTGYNEFLKQLDSKLGDLTKRIEFLRRHQEFETICSCVENKQLDYSEDNKQLLYYSDKTSPSPSPSPSPKRRRISQEPVFLFDLNYPPPDEPECSCLTSEDYKALRLGIV